MRIFAYLICFSCLLNQSVFASESKASWGGFVSAAYLAPSDNNFYGYESGDQGALLEAGLHGYWYINQYLSLSGLVIARESGDWFNSGIELDYLNLTTMLYNQNGWQLEAKLGRFKMQNGIYGATRDVPFTRPSIILPQSIYPNILREQSLRADGLNLQLSYLSVQGAHYVFDASVGKEPFDDSFSRRFFGKDQGGTFESDWNTSFNFSVSPSPSWLASFQYRRFATHLNDSIAVTPALIPVNFTMDTDQYLASLQFSQQYYELTGEYTYRDGGTYAVSNHELGDLVTPFFEGSTDMRAYYLQGIAFVHPQWNLLLRYDHTHFLGDNIESNVQDLKDWVVGLTWNIHSQYQIKLEHHWFEGTSMLPPINDLSPGSINNPERHWQMLAAELNFRF